MPRIIDLAFERPICSILNFDDALGVSYGGAMNNINELIAQGVAEEVGGSYPEADPVSGGCVGGVASRLIVNL